MTVKSVAEVVRDGNQIVIPADMSLMKAIEHLTIRREYEEQAVEITEPIDAFIWDGALALQRAMRELFGWADAVPVKTMFGENPPEMRSVEIDVQETVLVPWGEFKVPGIDGKITTGATRANNQVIFQVTALIRRKHEEKFRALIARARAIVAGESVYKGKAFKVRFKDDNGHGVNLPMPKFIGLSRVKPEELVFSSEVDAAIKTSIFTLIEHTEECRTFKIPLKRGVLLYGPYGTGKSLTAYVTAKKCRENGWTFLYCERADELEDMVRLAHHFQPAVIFCEDVDRVVSGDRSIAMDGILNIIDGIESKGVELMVILTTNHVDNINKALLRPGRLDAVINVLPPDAEAVERLLHVYGRGLIPTNANLKETGELLAGKIPAVIREVVEKSKLSAIKLGLTDGKLLISPEALQDSARSMQNQLDLLAAEPLKKSPELVEALRDTVKQALDEVWDNRG